MIQQRKKRNSSKLNLTISFIFHGILILVIFFFAARERIVDLLCGLNRLSASAADT